MSLTISQSIAEMKRIMTRLRVVETIGDLEEVFGQEQDAIFALETNHKTQPLARSIRNQKTAQKHVHLPQKEKLSEKTAEKNSKLKDKSGFERDVGPR